MHVVTTLCKQNEGEKHVFDFDPFNVNQSVQAQNSIVQVTASNLLLLLSWWDLLSWDWLSRFVQAICFWTSPAFTPHVASGTVTCSCTYPVTGNVLCASDSWSQCWEHATGTVQYRYCTVGPVRGPATTRKRFSLQTYDVKCHFPISIFTAIP